MSSPAAAPSATRAAVLEAATELLHRDGAAGVTTRAVALAAGVQVPTIYRLFGDKDGLFDAVAEHVMSEYAASKAIRANAETDQDPVESLRRGWDDNIDFGLAHPDLYRLMATDPRRAQSPAVQRGLAILHTRVERLAEAGRLRVSVDRAIQTIRAADTGVVLTLLALPAERRDAALRTTMFEALCSAILTDRAPSGPVPSGRDADIAAAVRFAAVAPHLPGLSRAERTVLTEWVNRAVNLWQDEPRPATATATPRGGARARTRRSGRGHAS